jgi:hypothetical protein
VKKIVSVALICAALVLVFGSKVGASAVADTKEASAQRTSQIEKAFAEAK